MTIPASWAREHPLGFCGHSRYSPGLLEAVVPYATFGSVWHPHFRPPKNVWARDFDSFAECPPTLYPTNPLPSQIVREDKVKETAGGAADNHLAYMLLYRTRIPEDAPNKGVCGPP